MGSSGTGARLRAAAVSVVTLASILLPAMQSRAALGPVITSPGQGSLQPGAAPDLVKIRGTAPPGATVEVWEGAAKLGGTTAGATGSWSRGFSFSDGEHTVHAVSYDGAEVGTSSPVTFEVDATRPRAAIGNPTEGYIWQPGETLTIRGTGTDERGILGVKTEYWFGPKLVYNAVATCSGCNGSPITFTQQPPSLDPGYYVVKVRSVDVAGNHSETRSRAFVSALERVPLPPTPPVGTPDVPVPPKITEPDPGELVPGGAGTVIDGRGERDTVVTLFDSDEGALATVATDRRGRWTARLKLPTGAYDVRAYATDESGDLSPVSKMVSFYVDGQRPRVGILTEDDTVFLPTQPLVIEGSVLDDRRIASVWVEYWLLDELVLADKARCIGCRQQEAAWQHAPDLPDPGHYYVRVRAFDSAGNQSYFSTVSFIKTI